jgi:adenylate cyclase
VILPFDNFTGDDQLEYFVSGMHSSLIGDIGQISGLRVISKTSSNVYKGVDMSLPQIASELKVDAVVESTVMCLGDSICLQVKVISAFPEEKQLWVAEYREEKSQILNLYNRITKQIADEVKIELTSDEERLLSESKTVNPDAYELYLKGKFQLGFLTRESQQAALDYFNKAIEIDPGYASPYAGIAGAWGILKQMDYVTPDEANPKMEEYMSKAIQLDNQSAEVYYYSSIKKVWTDFDWEGGEESFKHCIEINPNFSEARAYYSHLMMLLKRPVEMREQMRLALDNDPKNPLIQVLASVELMIESQYDLCIETASQLQSIMPNNPLIMLVLFVCYTEMGNSDLAVDELRKIFTQLADEKVINTLDKEYKNKGFKEALNAATDVWVANPDFAAVQQATMLYAYAGRTDKMLYWLERSYIREDPSNPYIGVMPFFRPHHEEPRYIEIMQRMNLPFGKFQ